MNSYRKTKVADIVLALVASLLLCTMIAGTYFSVIESSRANDRVDALQKRNSMQNEEIQDLYARLYRIEKEFSPPTVVTTIPYGVVLSCYDDSLMPIVCDESSESAQSKPSTPPCPQDLCEGPDSSYPPSPVDRPTSTLPFSEMGRECGYGMCAPHPAGATSGGRSARYL